MLHEFIVMHRDLIMARTRARVEGRTAPRPTEAEMSHGLPMFLDQLTSRLEQAPDDGEMGSSAAVHGGELLRAGFTIGQVVHDYGDICQAITELAVELQAPITTDEFRLLNLCLDLAIAEAVTEFARLREEVLNEQGVERLGFLMHELRNFLNTAVLSYEAMRTGRVGLDGSTAKLLSTSLGGMRDLVTQSLARVRLEAGPAHQERIVVAKLLEEIEIAAMMQAGSRGVHLSIAPIAPDLTVDGDYQIVSPILTNLVQNACKFTRPQGQVTVRTRIELDHVLLEVQDECGGLPPGGAEALFRPYVQRGGDRSGLGLGLAICLQGARAMGAEIDARDLPGTGCIFTLKLKRSAEPGV
jgi:signal transduction histidine kinase